MENKDNKPTRSNAYWLAIAATKRLGRHTFQKLCALDLAHQFPLSATVLHSLQSEFPKKTLECFAQFELDFGKRLEEQCAQLGIQVMGYDSPLYPPRLKNSPFALPVITWKGTWPNPQRFSLAMVGTRTPGPWAHTICRLLGESLQGYSVQIISGLAQGIDSLCHQAALDHGIPTQAVLAQGLDGPIEGSRGRLAGKMLEAGGALISPFLPGTSALRPLFVQRNHTIAALSQTTLLLESRLDGGAMHTVRFTQQMQRPIFAIPGDIWRDPAQGGNSLIQKGLATALWAPQQLPTLLGFEDPLRIPTRKLPTEWQSFTGCTLYINDLQQKSGLSHPELLAILTQLELQECCRIQDGLWVHFS